MTKPLQGSDPICIYLCSSACRNLVEGGWFQVPHPLKTHSPEQRLYSQFIKFLAPLVLATVALEIGGQFLNGGMARVPRAAETLAAFGLAWGLTNILSGPLYQTRQLALGLIEDRKQLRSSTRFVLAQGVILSALTAVLGLPGPGRWIVQDLHSINDALADSAQLALLLMAPLTLINGLGRYYSGTLARVRRTSIVSIGITSGIVVRVLSVFTFVDAPFVEQQPILLPILVTTLGSVVEYVILMTGHIKYARPELNPGGGSLSTREMTQFLWPLAVIMTFQGASRPLINFVVSQGDNATEALAVLTVVYTLGHLHYGWVNELRSLYPAFRDEKDSLRYIRRFAAGCCAVSFSIAVLLFWTPIRTVILTDLIGVSDRLAELSAAPLIIFSFFPFAVTTRGYYHGVGIVRRMTDAMAPSAPSRLTAITIALGVFSFTDLPGATAGIGALLCGFTAEASVVAWGVRRRTQRLQEHATHD